MFNKIKNLIVHLIVGANLMTSLLFLCTCLSTYFYPTDYPRISLFGLAFPVFLVLNLLFIFFWLIFSVRYTLISLCTCLLCFSFIRDYWPVNFNTKSGESDLKVLSYNVAYFGVYAQKEKNDPNAVAQYILDSQADVICLQEADGAVCDWLDREMKAAGYTVGPVGNNTKLPLRAYFKGKVLSHEEIRYDSESNGSMAYRVLLREDTFLIVNNHFESNHLTSDDKSVYKGLIFDPKKEEVEHSMRLLMNKVAHASAIRAPQVDIVCKYLKRSSDKNIIVCGDFNDSPVSYTCRMMGKQLESAYRESGNGPGISYNKDFFCVRIDHIYHSGNWESTHTFVDTQIDKSDHYPLVSYLKQDKMNAKE